MALQNEPSESRNEYLEQVMAQKAQVEDDLRVKKRMIVAQAAPARMARRRSMPLGLDESRASTIASSAVSAGAAVDYRITGFWRWKNVIVPPNVYVVHTRRGVSDPLHIGLGISFRFDPVTDAFLIVPAAMQTIIINANCICRERQGVVVQGYVQWIIENFATAYKKLDFTDESDPMRVVNVQLREQAEAAIKDKVATMGIDEVLADKQPIIEELTARLRHVAEGEGQDKGLGLRIVTVQIKEAVVCSPRVWEMLQRPFRAERAKDARLAELSSEATVRAREAEEEKTAARIRIEADAEIARLQSEAEASAFNREEAERARRAKLEAETLEKTMAHERSKHEKLAELSRLRLQSELEERRMRQLAEQSEAEAQVALDEKKRRVDNDLSQGAIQMRLVEHLPQIARELPKPSEQKNINVGAHDGIGALLGSLLALADVQRGKSNGA
jgi:regulator of protease activity HflC (stomatin/prohibitin superfamily)